MNPRAFVATLVCVISLVFAIPMASAQEEAAPIQETLPILPAPNAETSL